MIFISVTRGFCVIVCSCLSLFNGAASLDRFESPVSPPIQPYTGQDDSLEGPYNYSQYQPYVKIVKELTRIAKFKDKGLERTLFSIGETFENRTLWGIKFHEVGEDGEQSSKKTIAVDCGAHAREWIAPSTCMYLINEIVSSTSSLRKTLKKYDWVIIPSLNPDGYTYTWQDKANRMWRKNRSYNKEQLKKYRETGNPLCIGVDINRNFNKVWGGPGAPKNDPCYEMYAGSKPFSEKESSSLAKYLRSIEDELIAYVTLHAYGQEWLTPWGFTSKRPGQYKEMKRVAKLAVKKIKENSGVVYSVGKSHDLMYPNSGSSTDWAYSKLSTPYTYLVEMVPNEDSQTSFILPPDMMVKNAEDITIGLLTMAQNIKEGKTELE